MSSALANVFLYIMIAFLVNAAEFCGTPSFALVFRRYLKGCTMVWLGMYTWERYIHMPTDLGRVWHGASGLLCWHEVNTFLNLLLTGRAGQPAETGYTGSWLASPSNICLSSSSADSAYVTQNSATKQQSPVCDPKMSGLWFPLILLLVFRTPWQLPPQTDLLWMVWTSSTASSALLDSPNTRVGYCLIFFFAPILLIDSGCGPKWF